MGPLRLWLGLQTLVLVVLFAILCRRPDQPSVWDFLRQEVEDYSWTSSVFDTVLATPVLCGALAVSWVPGRLRRRSVRTIALLLPLVLAAVAGTKMALVWIHGVRFHGDNAGSWGVLILVAALAALDFLASVWVTAKAAETNYTALPLDEESAGPAYGATEGPEAAAAAAQTKVSPKTVSWLLTLARPERSLLVVGTVMLFLSGLSQLAMPYVFGRVVDAVGGPNQSAVRLRDSILELVVIFGFGSVASFFRGWLFTLAGQRLVARLRVSLFCALTAQEVAFFDTHRTGDLISRLSSDTQVIQDAATVNLSMLLRFGLQIVGAIVALFALSWKLTLVMLSVVPVVMIGTVAYGKYVRRIRKEFQEALGAASSVAEEVLGSMRTVRAFSSETEMQKVYERSIHKSYVLGGQMALASGLFIGGVGFLPQVAIALVVWYGGALVINGEMTVGVLTSFMLYTVTLATGFAFVSSIIGEFMSAIGASDRLLEILERPPAIPLKGGDRRPASFEGRLAFEGVAFTYPSRPDTTVLDSVDLELLPGQVLALVGPSGGGKSTMVGLTERFYEPTRGSVRLDGVDIRDLDLPWYRSHIGLVGQEPVLFACSIKDNIVFGVRRYRDPVGPISVLQPGDLQSVEEVPMEAIVAAAKQANAHDFILSFPDGYDTVVGERGVRLSGGQKQRIAIARALLLNPKLLVLDEATSALDAESEGIVQEAIDNAMKNRTVLVIAHRLSTVRNADVVVVMDGGRIVERGTHDSLLTAGGLYHRLVAKQLQGWGPTAASSPPPDASPPTESPPAVHY